MATLAQVGTWYRRIREAFEGTVPASIVIEDDAIGMHGGEQHVPRDSVLVTRKGNTIYVHLKPLRVAPERATLLNDESELRATVETTPWHWQEPPYLRLSGLPVNRMTDTVMVIRLEFGQDVVD